MNTPVIAFKAKGKADRYLCDGIECGDWADEYLDTTEIADAILVIREDLTKPTLQDVEDFYRFIASLPLSNDVDFIKEHYDPIEILITPEQLRIVRERNGW